MKLSDAVEQLNAVVLEIERLEAEDSTELGDYSGLACSLKSAVDGMQESVDRRVALLKRIAREEEEARAVAAKFQKRAQRFAASLEQIKAATLAEINANPQLEFRGRIHSLAPATAGKVAVKFHPDFEPVSLKRILPSKEAWCGYPEEWLEPLQVYRLKDGFEEALRKNEIFCAAADTMPKTEYLRVR